MNTPYKMWDIECGKGWAKLYEPLIAICEEENVPILQIKEKFGGLRFYASVGDNDLLQEMIDTAEVLSYKTCEACGEPGVMRNKTYWLKTLCDKCEEERNVIKST